jgi:hypothetical protein
MMRGHKLLVGKVPEARVELARGCPRWILSPLRLPFRHSGAGNSGVSLRAETNSEPPHHATRCRKAPSQPPGDCILSRCS